MKRLIYILLSVVLPLCGAVAQTTGTEQMRKLQMAEFAISHFYVDSVDEGRLVDEAIIKMLAQLDPHSTYSNAEEVKKLNEPLQGNFEGIGVQFQMVEDTLQVIQPVSGGPSEKVGILAGDRIIAVNDTAIAGVKMSTDAIMSRLRGPKGTKVDLTVVRRGINDKLLFRVTRDKIPIYSIDSYYMAAPHVGYVRISRFAATTAEEFKKAFKELKKSGMNDLILDLQGNGGGYLNAAIDMANEFLDARQLIVYTDGRTTKRSDFLAQGNGGMRSGRLVVLVDEYSASASEILTGAIQDWDRGVVVGRRTFGKGLVQRPIDLPDGSMIRLTVSRYYTPAGRCIQKPYDTTADKQREVVNGKDNKESYQKDLLERYNRGEMVNADSIHFPDSLKCQTKRLMRTVYGGGGIMPDCFVPVDTTTYTDYHKNIVAKGIINKFVSKYIDANRANLNNTYKNFTAFNNRFSITDAMMNELVETSKADGVECDEQQLAKAASLIKVQLKALIARDLWGTSEFYQVMNTTNDSMERALTILKNGDYERILSIASK
jgi:carboxyl-terminal processing protease